MALPGCQYLIQYDLDTIDTRQLDHSFPSPTIERDTIPPVKFAFVLTKVKMCPFKSVPLEVKRPPFSSPPPSYFFLIVWEKSTLRKSVKLTST